MINIRAAVAHGVNQPMTIETLQYEDLRGSDVLVKMAATGLCHSDLHILDGSFPSSFPAVLGHEGGGVVVDCGPDVKDLKPGDHVIPLFCPECRVCPNCTSGKTNICHHFGVPPQNSARLLWNDVEVTRPGGLGTFADHAVVQEHSLAKAPLDAPLDKVFFTGCGVTTGVGAVMFTAKVEKGATVIVFGIGGNGLNVLQGARLAGARTIVAVDMNADREAIAGRFGATHFVNPKTVEGDLVEHLRGLTEGGADYTFECVGKTGLMRQASDALNPFWGVLTIVGAAPFGEDIKAPPFDFLMGKKWQGTMFGGAKGRTDVPKVIDWYMQGKIAIDELVTHRIDLEDINRGFDMMKSGEAIRTVITFA